MKDILQNSNIKINPIMIEIILAMLILIKVRVHRLDQPHNLRNAQPTIMWEKYLFESDYSQAMSMLLSMLPTALCESDGLSLDDASTLVRQRMYNYFALTIKPKQYQPKGISPSVSGKNFVNEEEICLQQFTTNDLQQTLVKYIIALIQTRPSPHDHIAP